MKQKKQIKICIRDDDLCYYSDFNEFKHIYDQLDIPVSISLIPNGVANHGVDMPYGNNKPTNVPMLFSNNKALVEGIKEGIKENKYELLLHGFSHEYKINSDNSITGEMIWKDKSILEEEIISGKRLLEDTFDIHINTFVAPSQEINQKGISIISSLGMNYSGVANRLKERKASLYHFCAILRRHISRLLFGRVLVGTINYKDHKEQGVIGLDSYEEMVRCFKICNKHGWNFVVVTHYWKLISEKDKYNNLLLFVNYIKNNGFKFSFVGECFE